MFAVLLSAVYTLLAWIFRSVIVKFCAFFVLFFVATEFMSYLGPKLPGAAALTQAFSNVPPTLWWFFDMFKIGLGLQMCLSAYVTRFAIRRMPVVG